MFVRYLTLSHIHEITYELLVGMMRAGPVTLGAGANVQEVAGSEGNTAPDRQLLSFAADGHILKQK